MKKRQPELYHRDSKKIKAMAEAFDMTEQNLNRHYREYEAGNTKRWLELCEAYEFRRMMANAVKMAGVTIVSPAEFDEGEG